MLTIPSNFTGWLAAFQLVVAFIVMAMISYDVATGVRWARNPQSWGYVIITNLTYAVVINAIIALLMLIGLLTGLVTVG